MSEKHYAIIDPGMKIAETDCFNQIARMTQLPATYHLPGQNGPGTILREQPEQLAGIIIFGGSAPIYDYNEWIDAMEKWFRRCLDAKVPTLGICWGHQWIGHLMGSKIVFARKDQEKMREYRRIKLENCNAFEAAEGDVVVSHRFVLDKTPSNAKDIVLNGEYPCEALEYQDLPIYSFQSHPEATDEFLLNNQFPEAGGERLSFGRSIVQQFLRWSELKV